jgi:hypothetical protein
MVNAGGVAPGDPRIVVRGRLGLFAAWKIKHKLMQAMMM